MKAKVRTLSAFKLLGKKPNTQLTTINKGINNHTQIISRFIFNDL